MSKFKVNFTLKQHTPIIHFQSNQSGATLRATELKPKFDKFLKKYAFDGEIPKEFLIDKDKDSLDYKITIAPDISQRQEISDRNPLFFGNIKPHDKKDEEWELLKKRFKKHSSVFKIKIFTFNSNLKTTIEDNFETFLANTNFGTRQSKGFGSFYLVDEDTKKPKKFNKSLIQNNVYSFKSSEANFQKDIKTFYSFLRAGINTVKGG